MAKTKIRGKTARDAVLEYCTSWTAAAYLHCWPSPDTDKVAPDATTEMMEETSLAVDREMMAMLRHEVPEQDDTASAPDPTREPVLLTDNLGSGSELEIMAGSFLGTYGVLDINTAGHWTYRAGEARLRELKANGPDWFAHYDRFFVTHEDGSVQKLTITLCRRRNDEVKETTASPTVDARVPAETFGENNEPDLRLAVERDLARKLPDPDQFDEPAPVPLWVEGRPGKGMPRREVTQDELRHLRLYPERDELSGGGLLFEGLLFFNAAERLPVDETKGLDKAQAQPQRLETKHQRKSGRVSKYHRGVQEDQARQVSDKASPPEGANRPAKKRGGGLKRGPYYGRLKRYLKWRKGEKDDLDTVSLTRLREDTRNRLRIDKVQGIPKSRSGLDDALKAALKELGVNR